MSTTCNCETPELEKSGPVAVQPKASTSTWAIDRVHSTAQFKVKHMMISNVLGEFASITGVLERDENDVTKSTIRASIDASTINTREPQRDAHLKSADFFHVENHPDLTFNSTSKSKQELKAYNSATHSTNAAVGIHPHCAGCGFRIGMTCQYSTLIGGEYCPKRKNSAKP